MSYSHSCSIDGCDMAWSVASQGRYLCEVHWHEAVRERHRASLREVEEIRADVRGETFINVMLENERALSGRLAEALREVLTFYTGFFPRKAELAAVLEDYDTRRGKQK